MKLAGFIGATYKLNTPNVSAERCVNLYPELIQSGSGKDRQQFYLKSTDGLEKLFNIGTGPIRLIHCDNLEKNDGTYFQKNRLFVVSGAEIYRFEYDQISGWDYILLGSIGTSTGYVSAASIDIDYGVTVFVDGSNENYLYRKPTSSSENFDPFTGVGLVPVAMATQIIWLDGYFIFIVKDTNKFYVSDYSSLNVSALSFASSEGDPDSIIAVITNHRDLWLLNKKSVEIYSNTGNSEFPFERVQGGFIENGCLAPFSVAKIKGTIFWLGRDANGQGVVNAAVSSSHERISTHAIEQMISSYSNLENAKGYAYQFGGHNFYVLNFEEATLVYDLTTNLWHERAYTSDAGLLERHRVDCLVFFPDLQIHFCGDYQNSKIYKLNSNWYKDDLEEITRLRVSPHLSSGLKNIFYNSFQLDLETGVGLDGPTSQLGYDPQLVLKYSDDGGHTWSNEIIVSAGKIGAFKTRAIWRRLGRSRDRIFSVSITDPVKVTFLNAEIQIQEGLS